MIYQKHMKELNVVYLSHQGNQVIHYQGEEGIVYLSNSARNDIPNIYTSWYSNRELNNPNDSFIMLEPISVSPMEYEAEYLSKYKFVFTWCHPDLFKGVNIVNINYPTSISPENPEYLKSKWKSWNDRKDEIVIVANKKYSNHSASIYDLRLILADILYKEGFNISWYGHTNCNKPYYKGLVSDKIDMLRNVRFSICSENTYDPLYSYNYLTEKLPHVAFAGAVPIYMGCYNIDNFGFSTNSYFDLRKYVNKENDKMNIDHQSLINDLKNYDESCFNEYTKEIYNNLKSDNGIIHHIDYRRVYKKMLLSY